MAAINVDIMCQIFILILMAALAHANYKCSWSNEHCSSDTDCCSKSCYRAHEGTNPRCRHSTLSESCIFSYHCADDLECGPAFNCCSPYWKMCNKNTDCCNPMHVCKPADGFYYDRCLYPSSAISVFTPLEKSSFFFKPVICGLFAILINKFLTMKHWFPEFNF